MKRERGREKGRRESSPVQRECESHTHIVIDQERPSTWTAAKQHLEHRKDGKGAVAHTQASAPGTGEEGGIGSEPGLVAAAAGTRARPVAAVGWFRD